MGDKDISGKSINSLMEIEELDVGSINFEHSGFLSNDSPTKQNRRNRNKKEEFISFDQLSEEGDG